MTEHPNQPSIQDPDRRKFLKGSGYLMLGFSLFPLACESNGKNKQTEPVPSGRPTGSPDAIDSWIRINDTGEVTVLTGKMELGQGIQTALMQMAAEELELEMDQITIIIADTGLTPDERFTAGSGSIERSGQSIRRAAAEAREILLDLAAQKLNTSKQQLKLDHGTIKGNSGATSYAKLLQGKKIEGNITGNAPLKNPTHYQLVGRPVKREDIVKIATGQPVYVQDMELDGMVHARVVRPPQYGAELNEFQESEVNTLAGVLKVVRNGNFLGVIARDEYQAVKAQRRLKSAAQWTASPLSPSPEALFDHMSENGSSGEVVSASENPPVQNVVTSHQAVYQKPYIMHGSIGPSCAIALWENETLTVWSHSQGVYPLRATLSHLLDIQEEQIRVIGVPGSGCYGHNGADDVAGDAAILAKSYPGSPVRLQWMREDEHQWEPYGTAMEIQLKAGLDENGMISSYQSKIWSDTHSTRPFGDAGHLLVGKNVSPAFPFSASGFQAGSYRNAVPLYNFPYHQITLHNWKGPLRTSALRGLGAYANTFAMEVFMDEMAVIARKDPVSFRLKHLEDPRAKAVINTLAEKAEWQPDQKTNGRGLGFAFAQYKNNAAYFAVIAEVQVNKVNRSIRVTKLTGCIEAGQTVNSDGLKNQTEGGMIQSASWTLHEAVRYDDNGIASISWDSYPIMRFEEVPDVEVILIDHPEEAPLGAGEAAQGPTAAAIVNALFHATGTRIRQLPLNPDKLDWENVSNAAPLKRTAQAKPTKT